jgi:hypothetical protein
MQLPRFGSTTSGSVFARIISRDNLKLTNDDLLTNQQRLVSTANVLQGVSEITAIYVSATTAQRVFDAELVELLRYTLEVSRDVVQLAGQFFASLPPDDPDRDARMKGREQMRDGIASIVGGCIATLAEKDSYRLSELVRLAESLEKTLPEMFSFLPDRTQQEFRVRVRRMSEEEAEPAMKERLVRMSAALNK